MQDETPGPRSWLASEARGHCDESREGKAIISTQAEYSAGERNFWRRRVFIRKVRESMTPLAQRHKALQRANAVRLEQVRLKRSVRAGTLDIDFLLTTRPEELAKVPIFELLQWMPHVGPSRARKMIRDRSRGEIITESLVLGALGPATCRRLQNQIARQLGTRVS